MNLKNYISKNNACTLTIILFLFSSFTCRESNYCKMSDRIVSNYFKEFAKPRNLILTGYGGRMLNDIKEVELRFLSFDALNVEEARVLYVEMMEEFLCRINHHDKIRPYLHNFPFKSGNIKLTIGFEDSKRKITGDGHVALIYIGRNQDLLYRSYNPHTEAFSSLHREPYQEARRIVLEN